jgi:hypothetical protein
MSFAAEKKVPSKLEELPTYPVELRITLRHDLQLGERADEFVGNIVDALIEDQLADALQDGLWDSTFFSKKEKELLVDVKPHVIEVSTSLVEPEPLQELR